MKKSIIVLLVILTIIVGLLWAIPILFKDDISTAVNREIEKNVNAKVYFDSNKVGVSLFKNFPNLTITLKDFGVIGVEEFSSDTLAAVKAFDFTIDLKSILSGDNIRMVSINLDEPKVFILITDQGLANYNIIKSNDQLGEEETNNESPNLSITIDNWSVKKGKFAYYDLPSDLLMILDGINHTGSGDFSKDIFDLKTSTKVDRMMFTHNNIDFLKEKELEVDLILNMNIVENIYTFRENKVRVNDFNMGFDGFVAMPSDKYEMDLTFNGKDNSVKSILSLIPGAFKEGFEDIKAEGNLDFSGFVKGIYDVRENLFPSYQLSLKAEDGLIQYPGLPEAMKNINIDLFINNSDGITENTRIDFKKLHVELGENPIDARLLIHNMSDYNMDASIQAKLDLADMMRIYPVEDTKLTGRLYADVQIQGVYDSLKHTIPANGRITLDDIQYKKANINQDFGIKSSELEVSPEKIQVNHFDGMAGNTDIKLSGFLSNYIDYFFTENAVLEGKFDFVSDLVDLNEWMTEDVEDESSETSDTVAIKAIKIPANINFVMLSNISKVLYDNLELTDFSGNLIIRDETLTLEGVGFNTLGGNFRMDGLYDTKDKVSPEFDFNLAIKDLSIPESYRNFITVQKLAPIAEIISGLVSTEINLNGNLNKDLTPDFNTLSGSGILRILQASVNGSESNVISGITNIAKLSGESTNVTLSNVLMKTEIENGRIFLDPFNLNFGEHKALIAGSYGIDGTLDYNVKLDVPQEAIQTVTSLISSVSGQNLNVNAENVKLNLKVEGPYVSPKIRIVGAEVGESSTAAKEALKQTVEVEKEKLEQEAEKIVEEEKEKAIDKAEEELDKALEGQSEEVQQEVDKVKDKLKDFLKKKDKSKEGGII